MILRYAFRCDIILPVNSTTLFSFVSYPPSLSVPPFPLHRRDPDDGWTRYKPENVRRFLEERATRRERKKKEGWLTEIHDENFFFRGFCGKNTVTQWHARKEVRYLKRPGIFPSSQSAIHDAVSSLILWFAQFWHAVNYVRIRLRINIAKRSQLKYICIHAFEIPEKLNK